MWSRRVCGDTWEVSSSICGECREEGWGVWRTLTAVAPSVVAPCVKWRAPGPQSVVNWTGLLRPAGDYYSMVFDCMAIVTSAKTFPLQRELLRPVAIWTGCGIAVADSKGSEAVGRPRPLLVKFFQ